ncbi:MAG TPA: hypothetical protein VHU23_04145 [Rhizomicrobium sp.]|jgi:hypothetical protein|nr:hypothetical protein [Rhizomicrobium sp.]
MLKRADWQALQDAQGAMPIQLEFSFHKLAYQPKRSRKKRAR